MGSGHRDAPHPGPQLLDRRQRRCPLLLLSSTHASPGSGRTVRGPVGWSGEGARNRGDRPGTAVRLCWTRSGARSPRATRGRCRAACGRDEPVRRRPDDVDGEDGRRLPAVPRPRHRGARVTDLDGHELVDFCLGDTGAMAGHSPPATVAAVDRPLRRRSAARRRCCRPRTRRRRRGADPPLRRVALELRPHRHRRQPLGAPAQPRRHRPAEDPGQQLLLPRHRRRVAHRHAAPDGAASRPGNVGAPCDVTLHEPGRRVQRPRRRSSASSPTATWPPS